MRDAGVTGVSARLETLRAVSTVRSGVGDLRTGQPVPRDAYVRIGSTTKTFVATVLLQLADEKKLSLDDTVERWLPGVVRGQGNDGRRITLRQLLQHTSGLPDYTGDVVPDPTAAGYRQNRWTTYTSEQRVAFAMRHRPSSRPGPAGSTPTPTTSSRAWRSSRSPVAPGSRRSEPESCVHCGSITPSFPATIHCCRVRTRTTTSSSSPMAR
ncbi:serine hydrolase domain-containing protein [Streptomyces sp. M10(2022)]